MHMHLIVRECLGGLVESIQRNKGQQKELKEEYKSLRDRLNESLNEFASKFEDLPIRDKRELASYIYWNIPEIRPSWLVYAFFRYKGWPSEIISPMGVPLKCDECGLTFIYCVEVGGDNRSKYFRYKETKNSFYIHPPDICSFCRNRETKEHKQRTFQEQHSEEDRAQKRGEELKSIPYLEYLQTPEWNTRRKRAYKKAGYKCQLCGAKDNGLNAHHNSKDAYKRRGEEWDSDLIVLCDGCNDTFHDSGKRLGVK